MTPSEVSAVALGLPGVEEYDHGGLPAYRVNGRRIISILSDEGFNLMLPRLAVDEAVATWSWGSQASHAGQVFLHVDLAHADADAVRELVTDAWLAKAPKRLTRDWSPDV